MTRSRGFGGPRTPRLGVETPKWTPFGPLLEGFWRGLTRRVHAPYPPDVVYGGYWTSHGHDVLTPDYVPNPTTPKVVEMGHFPDTPEITRFGVCTKKGFWRNTRFWGVQKGVHFWTTLGPDGGRIWGPNPVKTPMWRVSGSSQNGAGSAPFLDTPKTGVLLPG
jgi:hypothetical protein